MTIFNFYASRSRTPLLTLTLTVRFSAPLFFPPVKEQKSKEMLIIYFYIYIYKYKLSLSPFFLKGELRNFGLSVSVSVSADGRDRLCFPKLIKQWFSWLMFYCRFFKRIFSFFSFFLYL